MSSLLLFGAGASFGSEINRSLVPPLAKDLFDTLLKFEPVLWKQVPHDVADQYREDFEQGWLALAKKMPGMQTHAQRSMAGFFFRYGPTKDSLYLRLARQMQRTGWSGAVATLNYERMLPLAITRGGVMAFCGPRPDKFSGIELCFPHGCCHLFCDSVSAGAAVVAMDGRAVTTNGPVTVVDEPREFWLRIKTQAFPPVMSYFEPSKFTTSGANFIEEQRARLQQLIGKASKIALIGVAVREQDAHVWTALAKAKAPIYYCAGKGAAAAFRRWAKKARAKAKKDVVSQRYWNEDFNDIASHIGL